MTQIKTSTLLDLARERDRLPILLLPDLFMEGWEPEDGSLMDGARHTTEAGDTLAYERPEEVRLSYVGCAAMGRLANAALLLPPGINREGREVPGQRAERAQLAAAWLRRSAALCEQDPAASLTLEDLCVGFTLGAAAAIAAGGREARSDELLALQLAELCRGGYGSGMISAVPPAGSAEYVRAAQRCALAWWDIAVAARRRAGELIEHRDRQIYAGLAEGWEAEARRLAPMVRSMEVGP